MTKLTGNCGNARLQFWSVKYVFLKILIIFTSFVTPRIFCCLNIWTCKTKNRDCFKKNVVFFYQYLNVGKFHEKMQHLTKSGEMLILVGFKRWSKHRWNRSLLTSKACIVLYHFHLLFNDRVILHIHLLTYAVACFSFLAVFNTET